MSARRLAPSPRWRALCCCGWAVVLVGLGAPLVVRPCRAQSEAPVGLRIWANTGEDKVARDDLRETRGDPSTRNSAWDGRQVSLFAARNEVASFCLYLEAADESIPEVEIRFDALTGPGGTAIASRPATPDDLFDYSERNIELFFVRYLPVLGVSKLAYHHYDERHVPARFRRPHDSATGHARGGWADRPDHDKEYPDIAVPLALRSSFTVDSRRSQAIWCDVHVPAAAAPGERRGEIELRVAGRVAQRIPVVLEVLDFALPDLPTARTMLHVSTGDVCRRYLGEAWPHDYPQNAKLNADARLVMDRHFQLAHRHRISLIDDYVPIERLESSGWLDRLSGALFTPERGYGGPGVGVGNNVFCIGAYGSTPAASLPDWGRWVEGRRDETPTDYFVYLADESVDFAALNKLNAALPADLRGLATLSAPHGADEARELAIVCSTATVCQTDEWTRAIGKIRDSGRTFWLYNGFRPASGTFTLEDDGVALRELAWGQFKASVPRWFYWSGTYYNNYQGGAGETNVFTTARTFGGGGQRDPSLGDTGYNANNGDGVLFYPGTDTVFPAESLGVLGPLASLRLKHWRRGLQDFEYLTLAAAKDPARTQAIVRRMVPRILWEIGVDNPSDPTYVHADVSWPTDPEAWEIARRELARIVQSP